MRPGALATAIVMAAAACPSAGAATGTACGAAAARTLATDSLARVYSTNGSVYGCATAGAHGYLLGHASARPGQVSIGKLALGGKVVAYAISHPGVDTLSTGVIVRRLDNGETLHVLSATTEPLGPEFFQMVEAIVVKSDGSVAWIAEGGSVIRPGNTQEVDRFDRRGEARLEASAKFDLRALRLRGIQLSWLQGNVARRATLL